jgi:NADPH:quinone reductase-like Zn-dependent oxidoreductase
MRAVHIGRFGGPEVLEIVDVPEPTPGHMNPVFVRG